MPEKHIINYPEYELWVTKSVSDIAVPDFSFFAIWTQFSTSVFLYVNHFYLSAYKIREDRIVSKSLVQHSKYCIRKNETLLNFTNIVGKAKKPDLF